MTASFSHRLAAATAAAVIAFVLASGVSSLPRLQAAPAGTAVQVALAAATSAR